MSGICRLDSLFARATLHNIGKTLLDRWSANVKLEFCYFDIDEQRYCHLLDARTSRPVRHWQSISVCAPICVLAGGCATIAMLLEGAALPFLGAQRVSYLAIARDGTACGTAATLDTAIGKPYLAERTRPA